MSFINSTQVKVHQAAPKVAYSVNCSLCGCNGASVRCEKCNSMAFCIGCDDMYHRHPKRRNHLRQAVALEFIQALEKHQQQQQQMAESRNLKSPIGFQPKQDNQSLYPWRRPRTLPRMPDFPSSPTPTPITAVTMGVPVQAATTWAQHPSKMPVPPPRRKKKLSFSGIKDTFRKFVNPSHYKNQQSPEPIYAIIQKPIVTVDRNNQLNGNQVNGSVSSAFRPLPALPPNDAHDDQIYENTRKNSLPAFDTQAAKKKMFASTFELREYENFARSNGFDPTADSKMSPEARSSTIPRKNMSCQDISRNGTLNNQTMSNQTQPQTVPGQFWNNCANCSAQAQHQATHGSTQSLYPGFFPGGNHNPHAQLFSPNIFAGCQSAASGCASCSHFSAHHWGCSQSVANMAALNCAHCNRCPNGHSLSNSMEELHGRQQSRFEEDEDEQSDEEEDEEPRRVLKNRRKASSASTASHIRRTQSSYSMYPNLEGSRVHGSQCPSPNPYPSYPSNAVPCPSPGHHQQQQSLRSHNSSPSPSIKSLSASRPLDRYHKSSDNMSDSSSSQDAIIKSPKRSEIPGILTNGNRKLSTTSSSSSSTRFREPPPEVMHRSQRPEPTSYPAEEPEVTEELVNDHGQWSCRFCTFFNDAEKNICDICCKTRKNPRIVISSSRSTSKQASYSKQSPTSVPTISSSLSSPSKPPGQASPSTESEFIFDEKMIREQLEIERELTRRRENERRIEEENRKLAALSEEQKNREAELKKAESAKVAREDAKQKVTAPQESLSPPKAHQEAVNHEQIVARIIEEKISEKLSMLKLNSGSTTSLNKVDQTSENAKNDKTDEANSKKAVESTPAVTNQPKPTQVLQPATAASTLEAAPQGQIAEQAPIPMQSPPQVPLSSQQPAESSSFISSPYTPQPQLDYSLSQSSNLPSSYPLQQQNTQQLPYGPSGHPNQAYPYQQNGYMQQPNQTAIANGAYPTATSVPPVPYPSQYGSNQYLNQFAMQPPSQPLIGGIGGGGFTQPSTTGQPQYQRHQSFSSDSNSSMMSKPMNRFSSFDDLQSMSSVTSAGSLYGRPDGQKAHMESGLHIIQTLREAEKRGYTADDVEVAIQFSANAPLDWLDDNWQNMCETVLTMANNQIIELERASSGKKPTSFRPGLNLVTEKDARLALRICKGNIWQAVEKCIQRYQDNKAGFSTPLSGDLRSQNGGKMSGAISKSSKSFSLKVSGLGNGKANNDVYDQEEEMYDEVFEVRSDVAEEEVENSMNPDYLFKEAPHQSPMEAFLSSKDSRETNELLDFYIRKLNQADGADGGPLQFDRDQMEALIYNWRYEKMVMEAEREQMKWAEKEKRKMQKMLDLQRRIGGYLSDGTTTEEELDREVEQVFASHKELRAKLAGIDGEDDSSSDTTTHMADVFNEPGPSGVASNSSTLTAQEEDGDEDHFDEIERRIQDKLNSLLVTSQQNQEKATHVELIDASLPSKAIAPKPSGPQQSATQAKAQPAQPAVQATASALPTATASASQPTATAPRQLPANDSLDVNSPFENATQPATTPNAAVSRPSTDKSSATAVELNTAISEITPNLGQVNNSALIVDAAPSVSSKAVSASLDTSPLISAPLPLNVSILPTASTNIASNEQASFAIKLTTSTPKPIFVNVTPEKETTAAANGGNVVLVASSINANVASSTATDTDRQQVHSLALETANSNMAVMLKSDNLLSNQEQTGKASGAPNHTSPRNDSVSSNLNTVESSLQQVAALQTSPPSVAIEGPKIEHQSPESSDSTPADNKKKVKKIKVKKVKEKTDSSVAAQATSKMLQPQNASSESLSSVDLTTVIEMPKETLTEPEPSSREAVSATDRIRQSLSDATHSFDCLEDACCPPVASLPVPQAPVFSKLKGSAQLRTAHLRKSAPNLLRIVSASSENIADGTFNHMDTFCEFKRKLQSGSFEFTDWRQTQTQLRQSRPPRTNLFKSKSIDFEHAHMDETSISQLQRQRARNVIVHKLKSLESLPSLSTQNLVEPFSVPTSQWHSNTSLATNASLQSNHSTNEKTNTETIGSHALHNRADDFEMLAAEAQENPPADVRWSRLEYGIDFEWARTEFECELCTNTVPVQDIVSLISCTHFACRECLRQYLTVQIRERQRLVITCPFCEEPAIGADEDEKVFEYLGLFDPFVRHIVDADVYELFQRKLRDRALMRDPNFLWCTQCSSGFISPNPLALTVMCPDCRNLTCQKCKKPWKKQHFNISCEAYAQWEMANDPQFAEQQLNKHLKEFGIECPNCKFRYQLAKGGCMHFRCIQCSYDFCGGCSRPFKLGNRCFRARMCAALGLHAHHPRNCLFYLRDKGIEDLKRLLDEHKIEYKTELEGNQEGQMTRCKVMEQKETDSGMKDEPCNRFVESAGLCKLHYKEYLGNLIYQNKIDPILIFSDVELELVLRRENIRIPNQKIRTFASSTKSNNTNVNKDDSKADEEYRKKLIELILERVPLDLWE